MAVMGGLLLSFLDMAPDFVGILVGLARTIGSATGFIIPSLISFMTPNVSHKYYLFRVLETFNLINSQLIHREVKKSGVTCSSCLVSYTWWPVWSTWRPANRRCVVGENPKMLIAVQLHLSHLGSKTRLTNESLW